MFRHFLDSYLDNCILLVRFYPSDSTSFNEYESLTFCPERFDAKRFEPATKKSPQSTIDIRTIKCNSCISVVESRSVSCWIAERHTSGNQCASLSIFPASTRSVVCYTNNTLALALLLLQWHCFCDRHTQSPIPQARAGSEQLSVRYSKL